MSRRWRFLALQDLPEGGRDRCWRLGSQRSGPEFLAEDVHDHQDVLEIAAGLRREVREVGHPAIVDVRGGEMPLPEVRFLLRYKTLATRPIRIAIGAKKLPDCVFLVVHFVDDLVRDILLISPEVFKNFLPRRVVELSGCVVDALCHDTRL